jgi:GAF domain-containing protein
LVQRLFLAVAEPMGLDFYVHYRYPGEGSELGLASTAGVGADRLSSLGTMVLGEAVCGRVALTQTPMAFSDVDRSEDEWLTLAASLGARTYASYPLLDGAELLGTLSFGSRTRPSLAELELDVLRLATDVLAAAVAHHRDHQALDDARNEVGVLTRRVQELSEQDGLLRLEVEQLTGAVASHDHVAKVKGMLMLALGISDQQAWQLLVRLSQTTNRKLRDVVTILGDHLLQHSQLPDDLDNRLQGGLVASDRLVADDQAG